MVGAWPRKPQTGSVGAFLGYNVEWENVILGLEANYNRVSLNATSSDYQRSFTDSTNLPAGHHYFYSLTTTAQSSLRMTDIATFRGRAGWEAGNFLPYAFVRSRRRPCQYFHRLDLVVSQQ